MSTMARNPRPDPRRRSWRDARRAFTDAAHWFVQVVPLAAGRWSSPGLGEWDLRALVGHTSRALLTVETYLDRPAPTVQVGSAADYFRATRAIAASPDVAGRGRQAGCALGDDPAGAVTAIADRVLQLIGSSSGTEVVTTVVGGMRLEDYLRTRTFELTVHTADLAAALSEPLDVPATAAAQTLQIISDLAVANALAGPLLLAATGRPGLPAGYSVL